MDKLKKQNIADSLKRKIYSNNKNPLKIFYESYYFSVRLKKIIPWLIFPTITSEIMNKIKIKNKLLSITIFYLIYNFSLKCK